jgi:hypothetical protein
MSRDFHVIRDPHRRGWNVTRAGRTLSHHRKQSRAVTMGRRAARRMRVDLVTHGCDGRVRSKDSYGNESPVRDGEH